MPSPDAVPPAPPKDRSHWRFWKFDSFEEQRRAQVREWQRLSGSRRLAAGPPGNSRANTGSAPKAKTPMNSDFRDLLRILIEEEIGYPVAGGYAVIHHARPRYTRDLDLWLEPSPADARLRRR